MTNNKQQPNAYLVFFVSLIFIYLMASFCMWDLNPSHWKIEFRSTFAIFGPCMAMLCVVSVKLNS